MPTLEHAPPRVAGQPGPFHAASEVLEALLHTDVAECLSVARRTAATAAESLDTHTQMVAEHYVATACRLRGDDTGALAACERTIVLAIEIGATVWQARALECRGLVHHALDDDERAVDLLSRAVELCRETGDLAATADALTVLGQTYASIPSLAARAAATLAEARQLGKAGGDPDGAAAAQVGLALTYIATSQQIARTNARGAVAAARQALRAAQLAVEEADAAGLSGLAVDARLAVAASLAATGDDEALGRALDSIDAMLRRFPSPGQQLALHRHRAAWLRRTKRLDEASGEARAGLALCATLERPADRTALLGVLAAALEETGDLAGALAAHREFSEAITGRLDGLARRRSVLLSARLDTEEARRAADREHRRALELEERNTKLIWEANHDALTGLANRRALEAELMAWCDGAPGPLSVCILDVDFFKRVNDECSHQAGDRVLARLGQAIAGAVRGGDLASRYGGEEFVLVLPGATAAAAAAVAERVRSQIASLRWDDPVPGGRVTVSVGTVTATGAMTPAALLEAADAALYRAKAAGRNRVVAA